MPQFVSSSELDVETLNRRVHIQLLTAVTTNRQSPSTVASPHQISRAFKEAELESFGQEANCTEFAARSIIQMFSEKITTPDFADISKTANSAAGSFARRGTTATDILRERRSRLEHNPDNRPLTLSITHNFSSQSGAQCDVGEAGWAMTCHCVFPPDGVRVRPTEGRTDEASKVFGRADYRGVEGA